MPGHAEGHFRKAFQKWPHGEGIQGIMATLEAAHGVLSTVAFCFPLLDPDKDCGPVCGVLLHLEKNDQV